MEPATQPEQDKQSFAEAALRLGGKSDEEARRLGAVDRADEQVETLFAPQYQTAQSPVHRAIWDGKVPLDLFAPPPLPPEAPSDAVMQKSLAVVRRRRDAKALFNEHGKLSNETIAELADAGYWGRLIGLVAKLNGKPPVLIAGLPEENEQFRIVRYGLYALKNAYNVGLRFTGFRVPKENLLVPKTGDGLTIAYHGLNLGRLALCAS